jgi:hypothetical protein
MGIVRNRLLFSEVRVKREIGVVELIDVFFPMKITFLNEEAAWIAGSISREKSMTNQDETIQRPMVDC